MGYNCSFFFFYLQVDLSGTSEYDPEASSQVTPVSTFKCADFFKDAETLSQMIPFSNNYLSVAADKHVSEASTTAKAKMTPLLQSTLHQRESNSSNRRRSKRLYSHFHDYNKFCFFTIPDPELLPILYYNLHQY